MAKPSNPASPGIRANSNLILKGKTIPLVLEKSKNTENKVPNILRPQNNAPNAASKNTIDRQIVSHEATIELKKSKKMQDLLQPLQENNNENTEELADLSDINLKVKKNEFGALEVIEDQNIDLICRESLKDSPPKKPEINNIKKEEPKVRDDDILCCGGCGCYGMAGEFYSSEACCSTCHSRILQKTRDKQKKERELAIQKQRREQRKKEKQQKVLELEESEESEGIALKLSYVYSFKSQLSFILLEIDSSKTNSISIFR